ncbi:MAG: N-acetylmuramoyl-L-alanine amidase [Actinomycetota bacterium]
MRTIRVGDAGADVADIQHRLLSLGASIDPAELNDTYGSSTSAAVRGFQQRRGLLVDGIVGPETWSELVEAGFGLGDRTLYLRNPHSRGDDVRALQRRLNALGFDAGREDGIFGPRCDRAVRELQRNVGRDPDGIVGPDTVTALERLRPQLDAVSRSMVREAEAMRRLEATIAGARIAIDPGHGPDDPGTCGPTGVSEADATFWLALELAEELRRRGADPVLLREQAASPTPSERAQLANDLGAEVCLSIHLNGHADPGAEGATCFYFGTQETLSPAGQRLAELVQEELTSRTGLMDGRIHAMSITILRETQMPAVQVEPCFLTNPKEERLLQEEAFRQDVAIAMAEGLQRFFNPRGPRGAGPA